MLSVMTWRCDLSCIW